MPKEEDCSNHCSLLLLNPKSNADRCALTRQFGTENLTALPIIAIILILQTSKHLRQIITAEEIPILLGTLKVVMEGLLDNRQEDFRSLRCKRCHIHDVTSPDESVGLFRDAPYQLVL